MPVPGVKVLTDKGVSSTYSKFNADGTEERYKERWVAKGCEQRAFCQECTQSEAPATWCKHLILIKTLEGLDRNEVSAPSSRCSDMHALIAAHNPNRASKQNVCAWGWPKLRIHTR
jgi:hypothetical protein